MNAFLADLKRTFTNPAEYKKFYVAATGVIAYLVANNLINGEALRWTNIILGIITAAGVRQISNSTGE